MNKGKSQKQAIVFALISVFIWSTVASAFKLALRGMNPWQLIFVATWVSLFVYLLILLITGKLKQLVSISKKDIGRSAILGLLNPFGYYLILFKAYELNPAQVTQTLNMIWPVTLALLSAPLLGQKITIKNVYAVLLSFVGLVFVASQGSIDGFSKTDSLGAGLALFSSIIWAFYWVYSVKNTRDKLIMMFWNFVFGVVYLLLFGLIDFNRNIDFQLDRSFWAAIYVGIFELGITYLVWMKALEKSENNAATGNFIFLAPFLSLIFIYFILNERIYGTTFVGLCLILAGILIQQIKRKDDTLRNK